MNTEQMNKKLEKLSCIYQEEYDIYCEHMIKMHMFSIMTCEEFIIHNYL